MNTSTSKETDRLIDFRQVSALIGSNCKTSHIVRRLAEEGKIRAVRINERVIRFSEKSVMDLIAGKATTQTPSN